MVGDGVALASVSCCCPRSSWREVTNWNHYLEASPWRLREAWVLTQGQPGLCPNASGASLNHPSNMAVPITSPLPCINVLESTKHCSQPDENISHSRGTCSSLHLILCVDHCPVGTDDAPWTAAGARTRPAALPHSRTHTAGGERLGTQAGTPFFNPWNPYFYLEWARIITFWKLI